VIENSSEGVPVQLMRIWSPARTRGACHFTPASSMSPQRSVMNSLTSPIRSGRARISEASDQLSASSPLIRVSIHSPAGWDNAAAADSSLPITHERSKHLACIAGRK
jgi:hypothetical protein